jgi:hypothetical protein
MLVAVTHTDAAVEHATTALRYIRPDWRMRYPVNTRVGGRITFKGGKGTKFCGVDPGDDKLKCTYSLPHSSQVVGFSMLDGGDGTRVLKYKGYYCGLYHDGTEIKCKETKLPATGRFRFTDETGRSGSGNDSSDRNNFSFKGTNDKVCCDQGNDGVKCSRDKVGSWETFHMLNQNWD